MAANEKNRIQLKLAEDFVSSWKKSTGPIDLFIGAFVFDVAGAHVVQRDRYSCTIEAAGDETALRERAEKILKKRFSLDVNDPNVMFRIMPGAKKAEAKEETAQEPEKTEDAVEGAKPSDENKVWTLKLSLSDKWQGETLEPFETGMKSRFADCEAIRADASSVTLEVTAPDRAAVKKAAYEVLMEMDAVGAVQQLTIENADEDAAAEENETPANVRREAEDKPKLKPEEEQTRKNEPAAVARIENLIGMESLKALARELVDVAPQILRHKTQDAFARRSYLFMIGEGCGFSTWLKLLAELIDGLELFPFSSSKRVLEVAPDKSLDDMLRAADGHGSAKRLVCFDIREWMDKVRTPEFRAFLHSLYAMTDEQLFVFRIPYVDEETQKNVADALRDVMTIREVAVAPYTMAQFRQYAERLLAERSFTMEEDGWQVFEQRIVDEKNDGHFYGMTTVKKVVDEFLYEKHLSAARAADDSADERRIAAADLPASPVVRAQAIDAMSQLDALIGMGPIKERLQEVMAQIELAQKSDKNLRPSLHMRFTGRPGTGKTTVARIVGQLMKERGLLSKGQFFEYAGRDFCGRYIGETAPKTAAMCRDAYGSVLFIDEAYSLYRGDGDSRDYGREAIDTLIAQMENHRQDFMVIMAGYPQDMDKLMSANAGLASRMPYTIEFPNYTRDELAQIFMTMVKKSFEWEPSLEDSVAAYFGNLSDEIMEADDFANARFVRNLFERTWGKASIRRSLDPEAPILLRAVDFEKACADSEFAEMQKTVKQRIGF